MKTVIVRTSEKVLATPLHVRAIGRKASRDTAKTVNYPMISQVVLPSLVFKTKVASINGVKIICKLQD